MAWDGLDIEGLSNAAHRRWFGRAAFLKRSWRSANHWGSDFFYQGCFAEEGLEVCQPALVIGRFQVLQNWS
jgi:hypothetical protein